jgi:uncharacterized RDD family membrane protein YckC
LEPPPAHDPERQRRHRFILVWMLGTALWIAAMLIAEAAIRPAPGFYVMGPLVFGVPTLGFIVGYLMFWRLR